MPAACGFVVSLGSTNRVHGVPPITRSTARDASGHEDEMPKFTKIDALRYLEDHASVMDSSGNPPNPFGTSVWMRHFVEDAVHDDWTLYFPEVRGDGHSTMCLYLDPARPTRAHAVANFYTSLFAPLASSAADRGAALGSIVRELGRERPRLSAVNLAPLDAASLDVVGLERALSARGWFVRRYRCFGNCYLPCAGMSFDEYMAGRDSKLRNTCERKTKKLLGSGSLEIVTRTADVDKAMSAYEAIYSKSWKQPEPYPNFARGWALRCAEQGWLRLGIARVGDTPIAAQIWFVFDRRAYIFKLAYDESHAKWSAGTVLTAHLMRHVLEVDRVVEVDFLSGDDPYKSTWMTERRDRVGLMACNLLSPEGLLLAAKEFAAQATAPLRASRRRSWGRHAEVVR